MIRRVFIAHPKSSEDATLDECLTRAVEAFKEINDRRPEPFQIEFTLGRDSALAWEKRRKGAAFDWDGWVEHITGQDKPFGGELRFHYFVVTPSRQIGRATAAIVTAALKILRPVYFLELYDIPPTGPLSRIRGLTQMDSDDWKAGWCVMFGD